METAAYAYPATSLGAGALVEIDCAPGQDTAVAQVLSADARAVTVEHAAGGRDLLEGSIWRLRSLTRAQQEALSAVRKSAGTPRAELAGHRDLIVALGENGRLSLSELAARLGVSVDTAGRRLARLVDSGRLVLRCDLARSLSGSPVSVTFFGSVPAEHLEATARELAKLPETRLCVGVSGPQNFVATVWVGSLGDVQALEVRLAHALPHLRIVDRAVALRAVKLMGRLLDAGGRAVGFVPIDLWNGEYA
ncbi:Lrp/AsnC family transcriptional regulator [Streptomyces sp. NPDC050844]|uniref:Lrp/AsnC family transcriptional regulator n=1 Tax=Streptomyces sp. NPDC050844 TaxID=3155790 RepID=UPI0034102745